MSGDERDITACIPTAGSRPSQRQRLDVESIAMNTDDSRTFTTAPWLDSAEEQTYVCLAGSLLGRFGMTGGFQLGRQLGRVPGVRHHECSCGQKLRVRPQARFEQVLRRL